VGFIGERALIVRGGRTYRLDASGTFEVYADGEAVAARNGFVLWVGCDDAARCVHHVGDATTPDLGITWIPASRLLRIDGQERGFAPDGRSVIILTNQNGDRSLVKLTTGSEVELPADADELEWTPDGAWLVRYDGGVLYALDVRDGRIRSFDLGVVDRPGATIQVIIG
jgi:hypothetical protein